MHNPKEMEENAKIVAELLKALANENRLLILCALTQGPTTVNDLLTHLHISQSGLSQHLAVLKNAGILDFDKQGQSVYYKLKDPRVRQLMDTIQSLYCQ